MFPENWVKNTEFSPSQQFPHYRLALVRYIYKNPKPIIMLANLENSAVAAGLEKAGFHSNPKERQCQRMLKLPHNCIHLTR